MCGIAGIIYRDGTHDIGKEMTRMLQSMKHRGPDSTGFALYRPPANGSYAMRVKLADANTPRDFEFQDRLRRHRAEVERRLVAVGARDAEFEDSTEYAFNVTFGYDGDLKDLADRVEAVPGAEVLSIGHSLQRGEIGEAQDRKPDPNRVSGLELSPLPGVVGHDQDAVARGLQDHPVEGGSRVVELVFGLGEGDLLLVNGLPRGRGERRELFLRLGQVGVGLLQRQLVVLVFLAPKEFRRNLRGDLGFFDGNGFLGDLEFFLGPIGRPVGFGLGQVALRLVERDALFSEFLGERGGVELGDLLARLDQRSLVGHPADRGLPGRNARDGEVVGGDGDELTGQEELVLEPAAPDYEVVGVDGVASRVGKLGPSARARRGR